MEETFFYFCEFMDYVDRARQAEQHLIQTSIESLFIVNGWSDDHLIEQDDVPSILFNLGLASDCSSATDDGNLAWLVADCNKDCEPLLYKETIIKLALEVLERARLTARQREALVAREIGFSQDQILELRFLFSQMTTSGVVGVNEVRRLLEELHPGFEIRDSFIEQHINKVSWMQATANKRHRMAIQRARTSDFLPKELEWRRLLSNKKPVTSRSAIPPLPADEAAPEQLRVLRFEHYLQFLGNLIHRLN